MQEESKSLRLNMHRRYAEVPQEVPGRKGAQSSFADGESVHLIFDNGGRRVQNEIEGEGSGDEGVGPADDVQILSSGLSATLYLFCHLPSLLPSWPMLHRIHLSITPVYHPRQRSPILL